LRRSFNEDHILAVTAAICDYRSAQGLSGPLFMGMDTHALSLPAQRTALSVLAARGVETIIAEGEGEGDRGYTPTPVVSHAILRANRGQARGRADAIVLPPSHTPPEDGGIKYTPPHGGPADTDATRWIEDRANELLRAGAAAIPRADPAAARRAGTIRTADLIGPYVEDL